MVLSDAFPGEDPPDRFRDSGSADGGAIHIDVSKLAKPIPLVNGLFGFTEENLRKLIALRMKHASELMQRPLTAEETNAIARASAKTHSIISYGTPVGIAAGAWRAYSTKNTFRFPFWQPKFDTFNPNQFSILTGSRAVLGWHLLRGSIYMTIGSMVGSAFFSVYGATVGSQAERTDPALKELTAAIIQQMRNAQARRAQPGLGSGRETRNSRVNPAPEIPATDDASPTSGQLGDNVPDSELYREQNSEPRAAQDFYQPRQEPKYDDASPTGGQGVEEDIAQAQGSAWDRVRRGANSGASKNSAGNWPKPNNPPSSVNPWSRRQDSARQDVEPQSDEKYSISSSEEERSFAKAQAQKEFDEQVERERRGGSFDGNNGDQKRW